MGAGSSSSIKVDNETINKTVIDVLNKNENNTQQSGMTVQSIDLSGAEILGCQLNLSQQSKIELKTMQKIDSNTSAAIVSDIMVKLQQAVDNTAAAKTGALSQPSNAAAVTETRNSVQNDLSVKLSTENINKIIQNVNQQQTVKGEKIKIDTCGSEIITKNPSLANTYIGQKIGDCLVANKPCDFSQITTASIVAEQVTSSVMDVLANNKAAQDLDQRLSSKSTAESTGLIQDLFNGIAGVFGAISGPYAAAVLICCCSCCCCLILLVLLGGAAAAMPPGKAGTAPPGSAVTNAAANVNTFPK
jgi:hypothetical protein